MKLFNWVQTKLNGTQSNNTNTSASNKNQTPQFGGEKEEFSDWPQGFLSIGTLFIKPLKDQKHNNENSPSSTTQNPILDFSLEEVNELQKELNEKLSSTSFKEGDEEEQEQEEEEEEEESDEDHHLHFTTIVPNNKAKDVYLENNCKKAMINKKSLSFLLKKIFICGSVGGVLGPSPTPSLRDPILSPSPKTRMSKILRALLRKKIYPQNSCPSMQRKKYLGNQRTGSSNYDDEDEFHTQGNYSIKWDKTDTEYIVLEI